MNSEFQHLALDQLRYSLVWEGSATLYAALQLQPDDHALVITGAGCNVLNTLLAGPRQVTAIDLNPEQNRLLEFKRHVIARHEYAVLHGLLGLAGPARVTAAWQAVQPTLPAESQLFWGAFFAQHPGGLLGAGRLETYVNSFLPTLGAELQARLRQLFEFDTVAEQQAYFQTEIERHDDGAFRRQFVQYFDAANLSKGRDASLYRHAAESGGELFYRRWQQHVARALLRDSFFSRFFFFGAENLPEAILPPCYQAASYEALRAGLPRLFIATGEATSYLLSEAGRGITKASLSNIFEYVSQEEFERVCAALGRAPRPLRLVFWNLLQSQAPGRRRTIPLLPELSDKLSAGEACFYFENVRVLEWEEGGVAQKT